MTCRWTFLAAGRSGWLRRILIPILAGAGVAAWVATASAQAPAALVVDITGPSDPAVEAFDELEVGARVTLGAQSEITVMHYASCRELSLRGGAVVVGADGLDYPGARLLGGRAGDCPAQVTVHESSLVGAGVVLRSVKPRPAVSPTPSFLLAIAGQAYDELRIQTSCEVIARRPIRSARVAWEAGDAPLTPGDYTVVLAGEGQMMHAARIRVTADGPGLIVLRP
jgi:hypothetical protein